MTLAIALWWFVPLVVLILGLVIGGTIAAYEGHSGSLFFFGTMGAVAALLLLLGHLL